ncbi:MAG TPA: DNRLRE domain-containing protein, partial [Thermoanaerobaculia bacterium]
MRVPLHALVACAIVSVCFAASSAAATLTLYPGGDTSLRAASPNQTFGAVPIEIRGGPVPSRALIRFNLNDLRFMLGGGGVLHSAKLRLHVDDSSTWSVSGAGIQLHRIESDWTAIWATWNCPSDSNRSNDVPDCAAPWFGGSMRAETAAGHVLTAGESGWIEIDVTADLSDLVEPGARYGWLLRASDESLEVVAVFGVSETGFAPQLVIEYTPPF